MSKEQRILPRIVAGLLAIGGLTTLVEHEPVKASVEKQAPEPKKSEEKKEILSEEDPVFCVEHPIESELRTHKVSLENMNAAMQDAAELIRLHRYGDKKNEEKYFSACRDTERWSAIYKDIQYASEKTGVPERVLVAMGLIESQFKEDEERLDTQTYGPYQLQLETAKEAAEDATSCFGFPIEVQSTDDLKNTKTAIQLAALRLRSLHKQYGQLGLAIMDYAGGQAGLQQKNKRSISSR